MSQIKRRINELFDRRDEIDLELAKPDLSDHDREIYIAERKAISTEIINLYH